MAQSFDGDMETLTQTENTQPCLYLADLAAALAMKECGVTPDAVAGFSLGEIPALAYAGAFSYDTGFTAAMRRGALMAEAAKGMSTSMMAIVKMENEAVEALAAAADRVYPVNYNCPGQLVVSGDSEALKKFAEDVKAAGGRAIPLKVSSAFHSPYMDPASEAFGSFLGKLDGVTAPAIPVISNMTARPYGENVTEYMEKQINHPVKWEDSVRYLASEGFDTFVEVGVGSTLKKLIDKTLTDVHTYAVETAEEARTAAEAILAAK
jgi:[acyl-carrier-protein] S-malonyltransferase